MKYSRYYRLPHLPSPALSSDAESLASIMQRDTRSRPLFRDHFVFTAALHRRRTSGLSVHRRRALAVVVRFHRRRPGLCCSTSGGRRTGSSSAILVATAKCSSQRHSASTRWRLTQLPGRRLLHRPARKSMTPTMRSSARCACATLRGPS